MNKIIFVWRNRIKKFIDNPIAIFPFLKKRLYYNFIADKYLKYYKDFHYLNYEQTINKIIDNNQSIIRFGDDLFDMLQGIGLYYGNWRQKYNKEIANKLKEIISSKEKNILLCFNPELILKTKKEFKEMNIAKEYQYWTNSKIFLKDYYNKDVVYGSALCFNPNYNKNIDYKKINAYFLQKNIIIITSNINRFEDIKLGKSTYFIPAPQSDAWEKNEEIKQSVLNLIHENELNKKDTLILASVGTASKTIVYDLAMLGYVAWDTGQFFDLAFQEMKKYL